MLPDSSADLPSRPANLHTLDIGLKALNRLLNRRDGEGARVPVDRGLIELAVAAMRTDLAGTRDLLVNLPGGSVGPFHAAADAMVEAVAGLNDMLDMIEGWMPPEG